MRAGCVLALLFFLGTCLCSNTTIVSSSGQLNSQWQDWSWSASVTYGSNSVQFQNQPSIQVSITQAWGAFSAHSVNSIPMNTVSELYFQLYGGLNLMVSFVDSNNNILYQQNLPSNQRPNNQWSLISIPVSNVQGTLEGIWVQDNSGTSQTFYLDNMILSTGSSSGGGSGSSGVWWNGLNIAWDNFGYDIGTSTPFDASWFQQFFNDCDANNVNSARFWVHCDGRGSPLFYSDGEVSGLSNTFLSNLNSLVNMAKQSNVVILITLWSFDMCNQEVSNGLHPDLISNQTKTTTYLNNALIPMLNSIGTFDNVIWEVINEPEWCISETPPSTLVSVPLQQMQRFVAMIANTIHTHSSQKVTVGSASLKWNSNVSPAVGNWWSDSALKSAYSASGSYLDFYQIHYYDWMYQYGYDPCQHSTSYWQLDKPTLVGELPADAGNYYTPLDFMNCVFANDFIGTAFWAYNGGGGDFEWTDAIPGLTGFYQANPSISSYSALVSWTSSCC